MWPWNSEQAWVVSPRALVYPQLSQACTHCVSAAQLVGSVTAWLSEHSHELNTWGEIQEPVPSWTSCCRDKLSSPSSSVTVCHVLPARGMQEEEEALLSSWSTADKNQSRLIAALGDEVNTRLSERSCQGIAGCLSTPTFPQEDVADHPSYVPSRLCTASEVQ